MEHKKYNAINQPVRKKDSMQLLLGKPVYVEDIAPKDALAVKLLRSPHANAIVEEINVSVAKRFRVSWMFIPGKTCQSSALP